MFTVKARPSMIMPFMASTACCASALELYSTKPKPRERPLSRSMTTLADWTLPWGENASSKSWSPVLYARLPTYSLLLNLCLYS